MRPGQPHWTCRPFFLGSHCHTWSDNRDQIGRTGVWKLVARIDQLSPACNIVKCCLRLPGFATACKFFRARQFPRTRMKFGQPTVPLPAARERSSARAVSRHHCLVSRRRASGRHPGLAKTIRILFNA